MSSAYGEDGCGDAAIEEQQEEGLANTEDKYDFTERAVQWNFNTRLGVPVELECTVTDNYHRIIYKLLYYNNLMNYVELSLIIFLKRPIMFIPKKIAVTLYIT